MNLFLDDLREPYKYGYIGWHWVKTADEAIAILSSGYVVCASLDHDLAAEHYATPDEPDRALNYKDTGYKVALF